MWNCPVGQQRSAQLALHMPQSLNAHSITLATIPADVTNPQGLFGRLARDTVTVNTKSYVVLRYLAVNPGVWIMHCVSGLVVWGFAEGWE